MIKKYLIAVGAALFTFWRHIKKETQSIMILCYIQVRIYQLSDGTLQGQSQILGNNCTEKKTEREMIIL